MPSPHPETITYEIDKWLQSKWQRDTRLYTLTLWQNIYGAWMITKTWGSAITRGFGQSKDLDCPDYPTGLATYQKLQQRRQKRGYQRIDSQSKIG